MILYYIVWQARRLPRMYNHSACIQLSSPGLFIVTWFWDHHKYELGDRALSKLGPALLQIKIRTICLSAYFKFRTHVGYIFVPVVVFCYHIQTMQVITVSWRNWSKYSIISVFSKNRSFFKPKPLVTDFKKINFVSAISV